MMDAQLEHIRQGFVRTFLRAVKIVLPSLFLLLFLVQPLIAAANPPPVQIFYVPVPENQVFAAFSGIILLHLVRCWPLRSRCTMLVKVTIALRDDPFPIAVNRETNTVYIGLRAPGRVVKFEDSY